MHEVSIFVKVSIKASKTAAD